MSLAYLDNLSKGDEYHACAPAKVRHLYTFTFHSTFNSRKMWLLLQNWCCSIGTIPYAAAAMVHIDFSAGSVLGQIGTD